MIFLSYSIKKETTVQFGVLRMLDCIFHEKLLICHYQNCVIDIEIILIRNHFDIKMHYIANLEHLDLLIKNI